MAADEMSQLIDVVRALQSDPELKSLFQRVLRFGSSLQQVQVSALLQELENRGAPDEVRDFVQLLGDDKIAHWVARELEN